MVAEHVGVTHIALQPLHRLVPRYVTHLNTLAPRGGPTRSHCPFRSGYLNSSNASAPAEAITNAHGRERPSAWLLRVVALVLGGRHLRHRSALRPAGHVLDQHRDTHFAVFGEPPELHDHGHVHDQL